MTKQTLAPGIYTIDDVLSADECGAFVARTEALGFETATIATPRGAELAPDIRNNDRVMVDDHALAADLWNRVRAEIPAVLSGRQVRGLNERFRFYRYGPGQRFAWHADGPFRRDNGELSLLTFM